MVRFKNQVLTKAVFAVAVVAAAGIIGGVNFASAQNANSAVSAKGKPTKAQCEAQGFSNYGQCVKLWAQGQGGYGGSSNNATVTVTNNNPQSARSGDATSVDNGTVGGVTTGSASNSSSTTVTTSVSF